jgi:nucleotide sugar dehydrogenase
MEKINEAKALVKRIQQLEEVGGIRVATRDLKKARKDLEMLKSQKKLFTPFEDIDKAVLSIGRSLTSEEKVKAVFAKAFPKVPIIKTSSTIAETIKYVTNTFLAMKVSYANEIYQLCNAMNIDYDKVIEYARYDDRLGDSHWSVPGPDGDFGFGGHCFPKDIAALQFLAKKLNIDTTMLSATIGKNEAVRTDLDWTKQVGRAVSEE